MKHRFFKWQTKPFLILGLMMLALNVFAQNQIRGKVVDDDDLPLPGATISILGTTTGVITDENGEFEIVAAPNDKLVISFIGYDTQIITIGGRTIIVVKLLERTEQLDEVTIVAFGTQKKESVIGSITTIRPSELKVPSSNLTTALAGKVAGVIAYQRSGEPGADNTDFFIRGATTFGYKKSPLILIDGMEFTTHELSRLQPDDIQSFSIMKDATANALYGARGANGVILINTKEGVEGTAKVDIRVENSISSNTKNLELADPITYMQLNNEAVLTRNPIGILPYTQSKIDNTISGINPIMFPTTDWRAALIKDQTHNRRVNMNLRGGGRIATYYVSAGVSQDNGNLKVDSRNNFNSNIDLKTYQIRSNININITKSTQVMVRLYGSFDEYSGPLDGGTAMYKKIMRANTVYFKPYYEPDEAHKYVNHIMFGNYDQGNYLNPYADLVKGYKEQSRSLMLAQFEMKQDLSDIVTEGLSIRAMVNTNRQADFDVSRQYNPFYYQPTSYDKIENTFVLNPLNPTSGTDYLNFVPGSKNVSAIFYTELAANYQRSFNKHDISGMLIAILRNQSDANATDLQQSLPSRNLGLSGRGTYAFDNRFFLEANFGYNGTERFHKTKRFGFFPSVGGAWYLSNEKFWDPWRNTVSKVKLRSNYGLVGNDQIGSAAERFFYLSNVNMNNSSYSASFGTDAGYSANGISVDRYSNTDITWETARNSTTAIELGLFNKLELIAEYFTEKRTNILMNRASIPKTMGLSGSTPKANVGEATSKAVDVSLNYSDYFGEKFYLQVYGNFTFARNKYLAYEEPAYTNWYQYRVGYPTSQRWGYIAERLFVDEEEVRSSPTQNFGSQQTMAGDIKYRDVNGDGQITPEDQVPIGFPTSPEIIYGFGFSTKYHSFDFSAFLQGSARSSFWIDPNATAPFINENQLLQVYADSHWSESNRDLYAIWPRLSPVSHGNNTQSSTWFMRNGAFLRLKQIEFGYTIPSRIGQIIKLSNLRVYTNATNLLTFSGFDMWDIEMGGNAFNYPIQKVINFGVQIGF